ncbi:PD-(D/E)XK nuclease family protein [Kitasatospora sp. NPDC049285]|uniref:PD-(D/E)XK nuclease family protein n=1 Tax=Kitasatospora sp. NPDC049285 TaxID=3157096 RepID=UPI00341CEDBC
MTALTDSASTTPSIWQAAHNADRRRPRSRQTELGASDTVCSRRAAYIVTGTPRTNFPEGKAAILGTYIHAGLLEDARKEFGWQVERTVVGDGVRGHVDAVQLDEATAARLPKALRPSAPAQAVTVEDVKTKSTWKWDQVLRYGATRAELRQVYLYAAILRKYGFADVQGQKALARLGPIDVQRIRFRFVCRDNGEEHVQEFAYDDLEASAALFWVERVLEVTDPEELPRDHDGPGLAATCDFCPWLTACWGQTGPGIPVQTLLVKDDDDRVRALADYVRGHELETAGKKVKKLARAMLDQTKADTYGANVLSWSGGNPIKEPDKEAMVDLYDDASVPVPMVPDVDTMVAFLKQEGIAVPMRLTGKRTARSINVKPART